MARHQTLSVSPAPLGLLKAAALAALVVVLATACGESKSDRDASRYADSLCTDIAGWETQIGGIATSLGAGSPKAIAKAKLNQAVVETGALVSEVRGLELPDVDGAAEAKQNVDQLVVDSESTITTVKAGVKQIRSYGTNTANVATVVVPVGLQLTNLVTEANSTVTSLKNVKGPFEKAVKGSDACKSLKPTGDDGSS